MQKKHESILRAINNSSGKYNILTAPTHERFQSNWKTMPHTFYMLQKAGVIKPWNFKFGKLPDNHILLDGSDSQIKNDIKVDIICSQNKFGQIQTLAPLARQFGIPLISIEHTLPVPTWTNKHKQALTQLRGDINVFISNYSIKQWHFSEDDPSVRVIRHGIDTNVFNDNNATHDDGKILTVMNDAINRTWCLGTDIYFRVTKGLPVNPVGDSPGLSVAAKDINDLVSKYKAASIFLNCSTVSPLPMSLLEAAFCSCPIVTKATCAIPETFIDGENCWMSNSEEVLRDRLEWCLKNPKEAREMGLRAKEMALKYFSLEDHINKYMQLFDEVYGKVYN